MQWLEITVHTQTEKMELLCNRLEDMGIEGLIIEDEAEYRNFLQNNRQYWDYIDEDLEAAISGVCRVKFYLEDSEDGRAKLENIKNELSSPNITVASVRDEDWENNWKAYYKPIPVGERLLIVPEWEKYPPTEDRVVLRLDPGLIFGTGAHATTQMCLNCIDRMDVQGKTVLDLGCGSGILAIAALQLGAKCAEGWDIDPKAPGVVMENAKLNGIGDERLNVHAGDVLAETKRKDKTKQEKYDIVFANIVADVIISLVPNVEFWLKEDGCFICSGIIEGRQDEVRDSILDAGLRIAGAFEKDGWHCFQCTWNTDSFK